MTVHKYKTAGGKDLILDYIHSLAQDEVVDGLSVLKCFEDGKTGELAIKPWQGKIYEVYFFRHNRMFYVTIEDTDVYILHACKKQKNRTEKKDADVVIRRAKELGNQLSKKFI